MRKGARDKRASEPRERVVAWEGKKKKTGERSGDASFFAHHHINKEQAGFCIENLLCVHLSSVQGGALCGECQRRERRSFGNFTPRRARYSQALHLLLLLPSSMDLQGFFFGHSPSLRFQLLVLRNFLGCFLMMSLFSCL